MKEARVSFNKPHNQWIIRFWSETDEMWKEDSRHPIVQMCDDIDYVSETLIYRIKQLQDLGYKIIFV